MNTKACSSSREKKRDRNGLEVLKLENKYSGEKSEMSY